MSEIQPPKSNVMLYLTTEEHKALTTPAMRALRLRSKYIRKSVRSFLEEHDIEQVAEFYTKDKQTNHPMMIIVNISDDLALQAQRFGIKHGYTLGTVVRLAVQIQLNQDFAEGHTTANVEPWIPAHC